MKKSKSAILVVVLVAVYVDLSRSKIIDLTYPFNKDIVLWPGRKISFSTEVEAEVPGIGWVASKAFCLSEHTATHMDAPYHFSKDGWTLDRIPFERFMDLPGVCVDVYHKVHSYDNLEGTLEIKANYAVTREDLVKWEQINGMIPPRSVVFIRTGWGMRWPNVEEYRGSNFNKTEKTYTTTTTAKPANENGVDEDAAIDPKEAALNFPGFSGEAAKFLSVERNVYGVGIDTLSADVGTDRSFPAHRVFTNHSVYILENVANLHLLPARGFRTWAIPFKVDGGTGAPARVFASIPERPQRQTYSYPPPGAFLRQE